MYRMCCVKRNAIAYKDHSIKDAIGPIFISQEPRHDCRGIRESTDFLISLGAQLSTSGLF
jgi:hypothetical protein